MSTSPFASDLTDTVAIGDHTFTIRKLNHRAIREAAEAAFDRSTTSAAKLTKAAGISIDPTAVDQAQREAPVLSLEQQREQRYGQYDVDIVLRRGVVKITPPPAEKPDKAVDDLGAEEARTLHRAILDLSLPPIDPAAAEAERKND